MKTEIKTLIIGTILGAALTFSFNTIEKKLEFKKDKKIAIMCLKIELKRVETFTYALTNAESTFEQQVMPGQLIPSQNIPELDLATQSQQFMYYNEDLASKVYELAKCLESANKNRTVAYALIEEQKNPTFISNSEIYKYELKRAVILLGEIKKIVGQE